MGFLITTTGTAPGSPSQVIFDDLGIRTFTHPTTSFDLESEFRIDEIRYSKDIFDAISLGYITATYNGLTVFKLVTKFKINNSNDSPERIDYDIMGFHKKRSFNVKGEIYLIEYYRNFDGVYYSDLVVKEERQYIRDPGSGCVYMRVMTITWYLQDNAPGYNKTSQKFYSMTESYEEGKMRRTNVINNTSIYLFGLIGEINAINFLNYVTLEIDTYIKGSVQLLIDKVNNTDKYYMLVGSPTIKDIIFAMLEAGR